MAAAAVAACSSVTFSNGRLESLQAELNRQYGLWKDHQVPAYRYRLGRVCSCTADLQREALVDVADMAVVAVTYADSGTAVPSSAYQSYFSVEGLFGQAQIAINLQADSLVIDYDPVLHYPTKIVVDQDRFQLQDELILFASQLTPKP